MHTILFQIQKFSELFTKIMCIKISLMFIDKTRTIEVKPTFCKTPENNACMLSMSFLTNRVYLLTKHVVNNVSSDAFVMTLLQLRMLSADVRCRSLMVVPRTCLVLHRGPSVAVPLSRGSSTLSRASALTSPLSTLRSRTALTEDRRGAQDTCWTATLMRSDDVTCRCVLVADNASATSTGLRVTWLNLLLPPTRQRHPSPPPSSFVLTVRPFKLVKSMLHWKSQKRISPIVAITHTSQHEIILFQ